LVIKYKKGSTNKLFDMLSRPPTSNITVVGTLVHMEPFPMMHIERNIKRMSTSRRCIRCCRVRVMCTMVTTLLTTISRMGYSIGWIRFVFLKVSDCS